MEGAKNKQKNEKKGLPLEGEENMTTRSATTPAPFLVKTYKVVEDPATDDVISWNADGSGFVVWQPAEFARDLLPTLFKHCNFSSFVRQLNTYGFRKVTTGRWEFSNEMFRKGEAELICNIRRRKTWPHTKLTLQHHCTEQPPHYQQEDQDQRSSSASSSSGYSTLVEENRRLKKENCLLSTELMNTKKKCKELLQLVEKCKKELGENYADDDDDDDNDDDDGGGGGGGGGGEDGVKLFGVRLE